MFEWPLLFGLANTCLAVRNVEEVVANTVLAAITKLALAANYTMVASKIHYYCGFDLKVINSHLEV